MGNRLHTTLLLAGLVGGFLPAARAADTWNAPVMPEQENRRARMYPGGSDLPPGEVDEEADPKREPEERKKDSKKTDEPQLPAGNVKDGVAVRKVAEPANPYLYLSAKKLELQGGEEALEEAMSIYRMAARNGAQGRALEEAFMGLARCEYARGNYWQAFLAIEASYPKEFDRAALDLRSRMEADLAEKMIAKANAPVEGAQGKNGKPLNGYQAAVAIFDAMIYNDQKGPLIPAALRRKAFCQTQLKDYDEAEKTYFVLQNSFPYSQENAPAKLELIELLALKTKGEGGIKARRQEQVVEMLREVEASPAGDNPEIKQKMEAAKAAVRENQAAAKIEQAKTYLKRGGTKENAAAKFLLEDVLRLYPDAESAKEAQTMLQKLSGDKGGRSK